MDDAESRQDELIALASIYDAKVFSASANDTSPGGQFDACLELPQNFSIHITNSGLSETIKLKHLPPITLCFQLPSDYPSKSPPEFTLSCKWLTRAQLSLLCEKLDEIWEENKGEVVLFHWTNFLCEESFSFLNLSSPLDISNVIPSRAKHRQTADTDEDVIIVFKKHKEEPCDTRAVQDINEEPFDSRAVQDIASQSLLLATVVDYDNAQSEHEFQTTLFTCSVCFNEKLGAVCTRFVPCEHVYCKECMKGYFEVQIADGSVKCLTCPQDDCESQAHPAQVQELVSADLFCRYDRLLLQSSLDTMADIMYCPRKACACAVMVDSESGMGSCAACNYAFCVYCKMVYHGVSPCKITADEVKKIRSDYEAGSEADRKRLEQRYGRRAIKRLIEDSAAEEWLQEHSKKCPRCKAHIQKIDGCNKMTCTKCCCYFCWLCNQTISKANPYGHFNDLKSACFNKLFLGVEEDEEIPLEDLVLMF